MKKIPLGGKYGKGKFALVDDEDYDFLMQWSWYTDSRNSMVRRSTTTPDGKCISFRMNRVLLNVEDPKIFVDHKDRYPFNNQKYNLRTCTIAQNSCNKKSTTGSSSKFLGVHKSNHKWHSAIRVKGKKQYLGIFPLTEEGELLAAKVYDKAAKIHHGEFANLNFKI